MKSWGSVTAFVLVIIAIIGGAVLLLTTRPAPVQITIHPPPPTATPEPTTTPAPITVYVTGAVNRPESTLTLPSGSRVQAAIDAAGGASPNADLTRVNLAAIVHDGDQVHVPLIGEGDPLALATSPSQLIYINTATQAELETLPDVGPALAARIIAYRDANGRFNNLDDLDKVEGIGPAMLATLAPLISFE